MSSTVYVGDTAVIDGADTVEEWYVQVFEDDLPYAASNTRAGTDRKCGIKDWKGYYHAHEGLPVHFPGDTISFAGEAANDNGISGDAIVERIQIIMDATRNDYVKHIVHFAGMGAWTLGAPGVSADTAIPTPVCSGTTKIEIDGVELTDVQRYMLDIRRVHGKEQGTIGNVPYASTSTDGYRYRKKGRLDWQLQVDAIVDEADYSALEEVQDSAVWDVYTTAAKCWRLTWGRTIRVSNIGADPAGVGLVVARMHVAMQGFSATSVGSIVDPDGTTKWPE